MEREILSGFGGGAARRKTIRQSPKFVDLAKGVAEIIPPARFRGDPAASDGLPPNPAPDGSISRFHAAKRTTLTGRDADVARRPKPAGRKLHALPRRMLEYPA